MSKIYTRYTIHVASAEQNDILIALLSDWGIEGFEEAEKILYASGSSSGISDSEIDQYLSDEHIQFEKSTIADQNWNAVWESNFEPVLVDDYVAVRADFHDPIVNVEHEIVITPKMSFGTGHHATTFLMMQLIRDLDMANAGVFDFGTGTGILAILAEKEGAERVEAVDYDEWCILNASENIERNDCDKIILKQDDKPPVNGNFDIILANINKNIILLHLEKLTMLLNASGNMLLSGLLTTDEAEIKTAAGRLGLEMIKKREKNGWIALQFQKKGG